MQNSQSICVPSLRHPRQKRHSVVVYSRPKSGEYERVRSDSSEPHIELNFDCGASPMAVRRIETTGMNYVRLETITGNVAKPATGLCIVPSGINALCLNLKGTMIARTSVHGKVVLIPHRSLTYLRSTKLIVQCARG